MRANGKRVAASWEEIRLVGGMAGVVVVTLVLLARRSDRSARHVEFQALPIGASNA